MADTSNKLSISTLVLHWLVAASIVCLLAFGFYLESLPRETEGKVELIQLHKAFGVCVLVLVLVRLFQRIKNGFPPHVVNANYHPYEEKASRIAHIVLLAGTVIMPLSGMCGSIFAGYDIHVFGLFTIPAVEEKMELATTIAFTVHAITAWLIALTILLHVAGALKHHFIDEDGTLKRMLGKSIDNP